MTLEARQVDHRGGLGPPELDSGTPSHPSPDRRSHGGEPGLHQPASTDTCALQTPLALKAAGITKETPDPPGGTIVRDAQGEPTGILKDAAMDPVYAIIPDMSEEEITEALRAAMKYASEKRRDKRPGHVRRTPVPRSVPETPRGERADAPDLRTSAPRDMEAPGVCRASARHSGGNRLRIGGLKGFADGSLGSTTALFFRAVH